MDRDIKWLSFPVSQPFDEQTFSGINLVSMFPVSLARKETYACL